MASISIALSKGRIFDETAPLLARVGIRPRANPETSRKLVIDTDRRDLRLIVVRATDTPTYTTPLSFSVRITQCVDAVHIFVSILSHRNFLFRVSNAKYYTTGPCQKMNGRFWFRSFT